MSLRRAILDSFERAIEYLQERAKLGNETAYRATRVLVNSAEVLRWNLNSVQEYHQEALAAIDIIHELMLRNRTWKLARQVLREIIKAFRTVGASMYMLETLSFGRHMMHSIIRDNKQHIIDKDSREIFLDIIRRERLYPYGPKN